MGRALTVLRGPTDVRSCSACSACCTLMGVPELDKPLQTKCEHVCSSGCGIYAERPESCRVFRCLWLQGIGPRQFRPDRSGVMLTVNDTGRILVAMELVKGAATRGAMHTFLAGYVRQGQMVYVVHPNDARTIWTRDGGRRYVPPALANPAKYPASPAPDDPPEPQSPPADPDTLPDPPSP